MDESIKEQLISTVSNAVNADMLNENDAHEILGVLKRAADREIAEITEQYMIEAVGGACSEGTETADQD